MIGKPFAAEDVVEYSRRWNFSISEEPETGRCLIDVPGQPQPMRVEQISAIVLAAMKKSVEEHLNLKLDKVNAVVTVPAYFNE